jgi:DNA-binding NarL/FixJ family response regulator
MGSGVISVAVVEDHPVFRQGLARAIEAEPELELLLAARSVEEFGGAGIVPDVVLLDLHLPGRDGPDAVAWVHDQGSAVLVVSAASSQRDVLDALGAGASGYLTKDAEPEEIIGAVTIVAGGGTYVSPTLAAHLLQAARAPAPDRRLTLTEREKEILALVAQGERDQDIASQLFISVRTVRSHLDRIRDKTGRRRRPDLTRLALEEGLTRPSPTDHPNG